MLRKIYHFLTRTVEASVPGAEAGVVGSLRRCIDQETYALVALSFVLVMVSFMVLYLMLSSVLFHSLCDTKIVLTVSLRRGVWMTRRSSRTYIRACKSLTTVAVSCCPTGLSGPSTCTFATRRMGRCGGSPTLGYDLQPSKKA